MRRHYLFCLLCLSAGCGDFGGMRGDYPARDYDPKLTEIAQEAIPLINIIEDFYQEKDRYPSFDEVYGLISESTREQWRVGEGWIYSDREGYYQLYRKLGWDPTFRYDSRDKSWTFEPGDGSPARQVTLSVETRPE